MCVEYRFADFGQLSARHAGVKTCVCTYVYCAIRMQNDMCIDMRICMCIDMFIDIRADMCMDMCARQGR